VVFHVAIPPHNFPLLEGLAVQCKQPDLDFLDRTGPDNAGIASGRLADALGVPRLAIAIRDDNEHPNHRIVTGDRRQFIDQMSERKSPRSVATQ
jgi:hypothetical protein